MFSMMSALAHHSVARRYARLAEEHERRIMGLCLAFQLTRDEASARLAYLSGTGVLSESDVYARLLSGIDCAAYRYMRTGDKGHLTQAEGV